jgi:hypothetical protein
MFHFDKLNDREILNSKFEARNNASYSINYSFIDSVNFSYRDKLNERVIQHSTFKTQNSTFKILFPSFYY